ncbi:MAG: hypothetical protein ACI845_002987 [Gammaproteobacteria bacterium]|jgi:hypothetical protein
MHRVGTPLIILIFTTLLTILLCRRWQSLGGSGSRALNLHGVVRAQAEMDALVHKASFARLGIPFQIQQQYSLMMAKYQFMKAMKKSAKSARRRMIASATGFEAGMGEADKILAAMQVYVLAYAEYLLIVNDHNNLVSKSQSLSGVYE